jgi:hypothetical protein
LFYSDIFAQKSQKAEKSIDDGGSGSREKVTVTCDMQTLL